MILGIDPGLSGALAIYNPTQNHIAIAQNIPTLCLQRNNKTKRTVDIHALLSLVRGLASDHKGLIAWMEQVGAMPGQGTSSMFSFGRTDGCIETSIAAAGVPINKISSGKWKAALGCGKDKDGTILRANQLMPASTGFWTPTRGIRTKEECYGTAEASLIAYFGAKMGVDRSLLVA